jgi:hypothetical protein
MGSKALAVGRLLIAWITVIAFLMFGDRWLADLDSMMKSVVLFIWLLAVIAWCAFGVVNHAEHLAELLGEPLGTLILTLSIVIIEVALIAAVMLTADAAPTLGRDTMFAVLMIILKPARGGGLSRADRATLGDLARASKLHALHTGPDVVRSSGFLFRAIYHAPIRCVSRGPDGSPPGLFCGATSRGGGRGCEGCLPGTAITVGSRAAHPSSHSNGVPHRAAGQAAC